MVGLVGQLNRAVISALQRKRQVDDHSMRTAWATGGAPGRPGLHIKTRSLKSKQTDKRLVAGFQKTKEFLDSIRQK